MSTVCSVSAISLFVPLLLLKFKKKKEEEQNIGSPHHSLVPDDGHPLLHPVDTFGDLGEIVLADGLLSHAEGTVSAAGHTQVSTGRQTHGQQLAQTSTVCTLFIHIIIQTESSWGNKAYLARRTQKTEGGLGVGELYLVPVCSYSPNCY